MLHLKYFITNNKKLKRISDKSITLIKTDCTSILLYLPVNIGSSIGIRLNQMSRNISNLFKVSREKMIGHLLGDGSINYARTSNKPYFHFSQSFLKFDYF
jgi:hypothetical protein